MAVDIHNLTVAVLTDGCLKGGSDGDPRVLPLEKHFFRALEEFSERLKPARADRAIYYTVITAQCHR